jgi:hypothetical protein
VGGLWAVYGLKGEVWDIKPYPDKLEISGDTYASGTDLFCLQRRTVPFASSVGAVAFGKFVCIDFFACS